MGTLMTKPTTTGVVEPVAPFWVVPDVEQLPDPEANSRRRRTRPIAPLPATPAGDGTSYSTLCRRNGRGRSDFRTDIRTATEVLPALSGDSQIR